MLERFKSGLDKSLVSVGVSSSTYMEIGKLKAKIENAQKRKSEIVSELGIGVYAQWKEGEIRQEYMENVCIEAQKIELEIQSYENDIRGLEEERDKVLGKGGSQAEPQGKSLCSCGQYVEVGAKFCAFCGKPIEAVRKEEIQPGGMVTCSCGTVNEAGARFCCGCGKPLSE